MTTSGYIWAYEVCFILKIAQMYYNIFFAVQVQAC